MKEETKELVDFIKDCVIRYQTELKRGEVDIGLIDGVKEDKTCDKAITFLNSLQEIESHLCRDGYIQDEDGKPCCDGDKVMYRNKEYTLQWSHPYSRFFLKADKSVRDVWKFSIIEISKVEE